MNTEETPNTSPQPQQVTPPPAPAPTPAPTVPPESSMEDTSNGVWVPKAQYDVVTAEANKQRDEELRRTKKVHVFYRLLAISGLLLFVLYIGMLIWPAHYISKGNCTGTEFIGIAFWLNPLAYVMLLSTGITGSTTKHRGITIVSILFMIAAPIGWFITGLGILGPILCGV